MDENEIINLLEHRDESALIRIDAELGRLICSVAYNITGDLLDAQELKNDTLHKLWNNIPPAKPTSLKSYAVMVARTLAINRINSRKASKRGEALPIDELAELDGGTSPSDEAEARELARAIEGFLDSLGQEERAIFVRRYMLAEPIASIASMLGITKNSLNVKLFRLRGRLKTYLKERDFLE